MPLDAMCLAAVVREVGQAVTGSKIEKVYQPAGDEIVLALRGAGGSARLLLSANPARPRVHLTQVQRENPETPPMFCMLLRKHLTGGRILAVSQPPAERVVELLLEVTDELGDKASRKLVLEAVRGRANLLLLDGEGRIIDCLRRVEGDLTSETSRQLLPGLFYRSLPPQDRANPFLCGEEEMVRHLQACQRRELEECLLDAFCGISPLLARELAFRAGEGADARRLARQLRRLLEQLQEGKAVPTMILREGKPADFSFLPILQYGPAAQLQEYPTFSQLLDDFYRQKEHAERMKQKGQDLIRAVTGARDRVARKIQNQSRELEATRDRETLRRQGDIITANLHQMEKGMRVLRAVDFYDPDGRMVEIPLDPLLTPQQNAAQRYKAYQKAKTAEAVLTEQIRKGEEELAYLNEVLEQIQLAEGEQDLQDIRQELADMGYLHRPARAKGREKQPASKPMEFRSSTGMRISVGKNNAQNDRLTTRLAGKDDLWFHTQKIHGSHVILWTEGRKADDESIRQAAMLAAWFSQGRQGNKVPVDYTLVKYVKKPAGARPGMVVYTHYETVYVTPEEGLAEALRVR